MSATLTKEHITDIKRSRNGDFAKFIIRNRDTGSIVFALKHLGHLPDDFNAEFLYGLLKHENSEIRQLAAKNIGKLKENSDANILFLVYQHETDTNVRREIVSAIGRQRSTENKSILFNFLKDTDPKVVCQAIRALLVLGSDKEIESGLKPLVNHPNEMVRTVIYKQFFAAANQNKNTIPHTETYPFLKNTVVNADVLEALKVVPDESVHLTFTSPPYYNARDSSIA
ncbi:MAG: HEAT repeat domain-containing protein [Planctomycetaceae bacterium]|nr:HEAT repeat domain-containing protein [Planctomycetaceae bacterium]